MADSNLDKLIEDKREAYLKEVQDRLDDIYLDASNEMAEKFEQYLEDVKRRNQNMLDRLNAGKITQEEYNQFLYKYLHSVPDFQDLMNDLTMMAVNADFASAEFINLGLPNIYADFYNLAMFAIDIQSGGNIPTSFSLYNAETVNKLVRDGFITLPYAHPDAGKNFTWNLQHINSTIANGILTGESTQQIASNLQRVTDMDERSALRNARTVHNSAQNQANYDACRMVNEKGIPMIIKWSSARDSRTRDSHILLEGKTVKVGDKFSNGLRFPLDIENGWDKPQEIYNCRCKGLTLIKDIDHSNDVSNYDDWMKQNYYDDWERARFDRRTGEVRDIWKGDNPNLQRLQQEAQRRVDRRRQRQSRK